MKRSPCFIAALSMCFFVSMGAARAEVKAATGSTASGCSVTGSTLIIGIPQQKVDELVRDAKRPLEELTAQQRDNIILLKEKLDVNCGEVTAALVSLGENDVPEDQLAAKLVEIAERFKDLLATTSVRPGDNPKIAALKAEAQKAIELGELAKADALLADVEVEQRRNLDRIVVDEAETTSSRGDLALTRLRYGEAAQHFANAAALFPPESSHADIRISYLQKESSALYQQGDERGDNRALLLAIERYNRLVQLSPRDRVPLRWASSQNDLGNVLLALGQRESGAARFKEATTAYLEALKEWTQQSAAPEWAPTQNNLGVAFWILGERESGTDQLKGAVAAFRNVLKEWTRDRMPHDWAITQNNLGNALMRLGERESGTGQLEEAIAAFREALRENSRELLPLDWAMIKNNLCNKLRTLGEREGGTIRLEEAAAACRQALREWTRAR